MPRPKLPANDRRTEVLQVRLSPTERAKLKAGAKAGGTSETDLLRSSGLAEAKRLTNR